MQACDWSRGARPQTAMLPACNLQGALDAAVEESDLNLSSLYLSAGRDPSTQASNHIAGLALPATSGNVAATKKGKVGKTGLAIADVSCGVPLLDRVLKSQRDPVAAACKARSSTLKDFNKVLQRVQSAKDMVLTTLKKPHELIGVDSLEQPQPEVVEIENRYLIVHRLSSEIDQTETLNKLATSKAYEMMQRDPYFKESTIVESQLQTVGYMKAQRESWDLLVSTAAVSWLKLTNTATSVVVPQGHKVQSIRSKFQSVRSGPFKLKFKFKSRQSR